MTQCLDDPETLQQEAAYIARQLDIPACPEILVKFNAESRSPEPDLRRLAALIASDIALSATVIKTVNSPFFGLAKKVTGISQALSILGLTASANLISGCLLQRAFPASSGSAMEQFWTSSMHIAALSASIAARFKDLSRDEAHTYSLFRDCGMLVMLRKFPHYAEIIDQSARIPGKQFVRIENVRFKFNHAQVGSALARSWSLAEPLCGALFHHHEPAAIGESAAPGLPAPNRTLVAFGLLAEQVAALHAGRGLCPDWGDAERFVMDTLHIDADEIVELTHELLAINA